MRKDPAKVLWQGKHLDGFLLITLQGTSRIIGRLFVNTPDYIKQEFKMEASLNTAVVREYEVPGTVIVDTFVDAFDRAYLEAEQERVQEGLKDGTLRLQ